jgi:hypothetical protein
MPRLRTGACPRHAAPAKARWAERNVSAGPEDDPREDGPSPAVERVMPHLALRCQHETPAGTLRRSLSEVVAAAGVFTWAAPPSTAGYDRPAVCTRAGVGVHRRAEVRVFLFVSPVR